MRQAKRSVGVEQPKPATGEKGPTGGQVTGRPPVQSLSRGLGILRQFGGTSGSLSLTELSRRTGLHKATIFRFVKTLEMEGYLVQDPESGLYSIGPTWALTLYDLGSASVFAEVLSSDLRALAEGSREAVTLGVRQGDDVNVVHTTPSSRGFIPKMPATRLHPLHSTWNVHAQILLAHADEQTKRRVLAIEPTRFTEHTVVEPEATRARLEGILAEGVAYEREEHDIGTCAVGVPIRSRGRVVAALALIVPVERFTDEALPDFVEQLRNSAAVIGERLTAGRNDGSPAAAAEGKLS